MRKYLHKISLVFGLGLLFIGTAQCQNGELILTTPDLSTWTCEVGEVQTFIWKYNYTLDAYDKGCDDINPSTVKVEVGTIANGDGESTLEIVGGPTVSGCFVSLNFKCLTAEPFDLEICVNSSDVFQANGNDNTSQEDDGVGCSEINYVADSGNNEEDSDNDGVPDGDDCAPNDPNASSRYDACDDGNPSTVNDQYDSNCNCKGQEEEEEEEEDSDNDGVPDNDDCAPNDPNASSRYDACDDGNPNTENDQYDSNCNCRGQEVAAIDSDNDGVADEDDCAPNDPNASSRYDACDDGNPNTENDQYDSNCNCRGRGIDSDNDGVSDEDDCAPNDPNASSRYDACDDGNSNTINDQYDSNCNCRGQEPVEQIDSDGDGVFDADDCAPNDPNASSRYDTCDDGNTDTVNDQYDSNCNCRGRAIDSDNDGVADVDDCAPNDPNASSRFDVCDDGNPNTSNDQYDSNCNCKGQEVLDSDNDGVFDDEDCAPNDPNASSRFDACDDGNPSTINDQYDSNCNCRGQEEPTVTVGPSKSVVFFDLDECFSTVVRGANDYSEFAASYPNTLDCASFTSTSVHRANPNLNKHSCTPGAAGTSAMCVSARIDCDYSKSSDQALVFEVQVDAEDLVSITGLKFLEKAPEQFDWINGASGPNNYPTLYGVRVLLDGKEVFFEDNISTTTEWTEESFSFDDILIEADATLLIEMLAYCPIGNGATAAVWDIENIELIAACSASSSSALISGLVTSADNSPLSDVLLTLEGSAFKQNYMTSPRGVYDFGEVPKSTSYTLSATKRTDYLNGVSTLDLVTMQKHILGLEPLDEAFKFIAADINKDHKISGLDMVQLRKLILGSYDELPENDSYIFYDKNEVLEMANPWIVEQELQLLNIEDFGSTYNFIGIKIGDVNVNQTEKRSRDKSVLNYKLRSTDKKDQNIVDFYFEEEEQFRAIQLNLFMRDLNLGELKSGQLILSDSDYNIIDGHELRISQNFEEVTSFDIDKPLFSLVVDANGTLDKLTLIQDVAIKSELYSSAKDFRSIELKAIEQLPSSANTLAFYPNPFSEELSVSIDMEVGQEVTIEIFDVTGRRLFDYSDRLEAGKNIVKLNDIPNPTSSSLFISRVSIGDKVYTNKVLQVKE